LAERSRDQTGEAAGTPEAAGARRSTCVGPHAALDPFGQVTLLGCHPPQFEEHRGDANPDRADLLAGAAEGRRVRKIGPGVEAFQRGGEDRTHGPRVDGAVAVAADGPEDGADIETGAAADTRQDLRGVAREDRRAAVVDDYHVELLRPIRV